MTPGIPCPGGKRSSCRNGPLRVIARSCLLIAAVLLLTGCHDALYYGSLAYAYHGHTRGAYDRPGAGPHHRHHSGGHHGHRRHHRDHFH